MLNRRLILKFSATSMVFAGQAARASTAMIENAKIVCGFAAGGTADALCRRVAIPLATRYAKSVVVENRTGAGGQVAVQFVKNQPPDGATLLQTPTSMLTIYPHTYKKLPYNPTQDLTPVSLGCAFDFGFAVGPLVPAEIGSVPEFLKWAKANPTYATFGSPAAGSTPHLIAALLGKNHGVDLRHVAYRGSQPAIIDAMGGNVSAVCAPVGDIVQQLTTGKLRLLGVSGSTRSRFAPTVPTFVDQGLKDMVFKEWFAFFLPAKAAAPVVDRAHSELKLSLQSREVIDGLGTFGLDVVSSTPAELARLLEDETRRWGSIVKEIGFTADS